MRMGNILLFHNMERINAKDQKKKKTTLSAGKSHPPGKFTVSLSASRRVKAKATLR